MRTTDVMTRTVVSVRPDASIGDAARLMVTRQISGLPVIDEAGALVGIVTDRDLLRRDNIESRAARPVWLAFLLGPEPPAGAAWRERPVAEVMTVNPVTVDEEAPLETAVRLMEEHQFKRLPVMRDGRVVGVIARGDLVRALAKKPLLPQAEDDPARRTRLRELERLAWMYRLH